MRLWGSVLTEDIWIWIYKKHFAVEVCEPQTLYFLACLVGGANLPEKALEWLTIAIFEKGWWYRPEVLEDDDLSLLGSNDKFISLKSISDHCHAEAMSGAKAVFSWEDRKADKLFIAVHGNTQNGQIARADWEPILHDNIGWQLETVQSAVPDGYGTFRWNSEVLCNTLVLQSP